jgi:predicted transposase YbfD/YdcC
MAVMVPAGLPLPDDVAALQRLVLAREADLAAAQAEIVQAKARETSAEAMILHLRLAVEKLRRELDGQRSERGTRLHWRRDVILREDHSTIRPGTSPQAVAALRNAMLHLVKDTPGPLAETRAIFADNRHTAIQAAQLGFL